MKQRLKTWLKRIIKRILETPEMKKIILEAVGDTYVPEKRLEAIEHDLKMPKYLYHSPLNYSLETHSPSYGEAIKLQDMELPIPPKECRPGYAPDDDELYLEWGLYDHDFIFKIIEKHYDLKDGIEILDFGCSSGRVLRHFYSEMMTRQWKLHGTDIQAFLVEWMRRHFPPEINVMCASTFPHLPFKDSSLDVIYGISVFTHTKYLWDMWLAEFKRVLKPGGICIQTIQCETAWKFYYENKNVDWVKQGHPESMLNKPEMDEDFFFYGDAFISQTFYREKTLKEYWGRYMQVVDFLPPPKFSYQNWIVLKN